ncbi:sulfite oxidase heme-binding subunit YedZ [Ningiella sp. W23]|uniref:sulfite oxidase heme-binding subunit YedZ n=1 Tax=Ningiella sp. W23 TaxID=3023715 RepID=UPI00375806EB
MKSISKLSHIGVANRKPLRVNKAFIFAFRVSIHLISAIWLGIVYYQALSGHLEGDPVQYLLDFSGIGTLHLLFASLLISPLAQWMKFQQLMRIRKTFGVYAALYALFHVWVFIAYELQFEWLLIASEIIERPYITVGALAALILIALLASSFEKIKKKMGSKWQKLHNFVYIAVIAGCIHYLWSVKSNWYEPAIYLSIATLLLLIRRKKIKNLFK